MQGGGGGGGGWGSQVIPVPSTTRFLVNFLLFNVMVDNVTQLDLLPSCSVLAILSSFISSPLIAVIRLRIILLTFFSFGVFW